MSRSPDRSVGNQAPRRKDRKREVLVGTKKPSSIHPEPSIAEKRRRRNADRCFLYGADWRWKRARTLADEPEQLPHEDEVVCELLARALLCTVGDDFMSVKSFVAHDLAVACEAIAVRNDPFQRVAIESLVLGGFSDSEIAEQTGLSLETIEFFVSAFFDIRDCLASPSAIAARGIEMVNDWNIVPFREVLLKLSHKGGRDVALLCCDYLKHHGESHDLSTMQGRLREQIEHRILLEQVLDDFQMSKFPNFAPLLRATLGNGVRRPNSVNDGLLQPPKTMQELEQGFLAVAKSLRKKQSATKTRQRRRSA